jgi:CheY-like chemotaxis protein
MPSGGTLTVRSSNVQHDDGSFVRLTVGDSGTGIDPAVMHRLFEPFVTTKPAGQGTGLGLATVFGIVKQSGGRIDVASEPGRGTTFTIELPTVEEQPAVRADAARATFDRRTERVLVVDDNDLVRALASTMLSQQGYQVVEAADGAHALELAEAADAPFDLLVTDISMPHMTGIELAEALRKKWPELTIVYTSGYADSQVMTDAVIAPGDKFLPKPFNFEALLIAADIALGGNG